MDDRIVMIRAPHFELRRFRVLPVDTEVSTVSASVTPERLQLVHVAREFC